jgi:hypothetical protein
MGTGIGVSKPPMISESVKIFLPGISRAEMAFWMVSENFLVDSGFGLT